MGFWIYLYNVFFLCLFACAAFFCGIVSNTTENRRFSYLFALMVLLALEGVVDMGSSLLESDFSSTIFSSASGDITAFDIAKVIVQMVEEVIFYLLVCDLLKRVPRVFPFILLPVIALVRCIAGTIGGSVILDLIYLLADAVVIFGLALFGVKSLTRSGINEDDGIFERHRVVIILFICMCAYLCAMAEGVIYAVMFVMHGSVPFFVGKISVSEDLLWACLSVVTILYARRYQDHEMLKRTEHLVHDRLDMYRLEVERRESEERADDIAGFCAQYELTPREQEVLARVLGGSSNQQIADELSISLGTVKTHVHSIYRKLSISRRSELMGMFYERSRGNSAPDERAI